MSIKWIVSQEGEQLIQRWIGHDEHTHKHESNKLNIHEGIMNK